MTLIARLGKRVGSVGRKGGVAAALNAVGSTLDLVSFAIVARVLSPEDLGIFLIALAVGTIVERLGSPNLAQAFFRHTVRAVEMQRPDDLRRLLDLAVLFELSLLLLGLAAGIITAASLVPSGDHVTFVAIVIAVMFATLRPPLLAVAIPRAFGEHEAVIGWLTSGALVKVVTLIIVLGAGGGMLGVAVAFGLWRAVSAVGGMRITLTYARRYGALSVKRSGPKDFSQRNDDFWAFTRLNAITVLPQAIVEFATILIGALSGAVAAGLYRLATKVGEAVRIYTNPISFALYSDQCKSVERNDLHRLWSHTVRWSFLLGAMTGLGALLFIVAREPLIRFAFGEAYVAAIPPMTWAVIAAVPYSMSIPAQFGLLSLGAANHVLRAESVASVLFVLIIAAFGSPTAMQAAIALAVSRGVALLALVALFIWSLRQRQSNRK